MYENIKSSYLYQISLGFISNQQLERKHKVDKMRDEKIKSLSNLLENGKISAGAILECMSGTDILPSLGR